MKKYRITLLYACLMSGVAFGQTTIKVNVENDAVRRYLDEVSYTRESASQVNDYTSLPGAGDIPNPAVVSLPETAADSLMLRYSEYSDFEARCDTVWIAKDKREEGVKIYNLVPDRTYFYQVLEPEAGNGKNMSLLVSGEIVTTGRVRMINARSIMNVRDLGGWETTDGKRIKYEKLYRGRELNGGYVADSADIELLKHLGIKAEIDMRYSDENGGAGISAFGFLGSDEAGTGSLPTYLFTNNSGCCDETHLTYYYWQQRYRKEFHFIVDNLKQNRPVYFHCVSGSDRTGLLAILLEGLLGVPYDGLVKDLELTSFSSFRKLTKAGREFIFDYFETLSGNTLQEKIRTFLVNKVFVSQSDINFLLSELLEEKPVYVGIVDVGRSSSANDHSLQPSGHAVYDLQGRRITEGRGKGVLLEVEKNGYRRKVIQR